MALGSSTQALLPLTGQADLWPAAGRKRRATVRPQGGGALCITSPGRAPACPPAHRRLPQRCKGHSRQRAWCGGGVTLDGPRAPRRGAAAGARYAGLPTPSEGREPRQRLGSQKRHWAALSSWLLLPLLRGHLRSPQRPLPTPTAWDPGGASGASAFLRCSGTVGLRWSHVQKQEWGNPGDQTQKVQLCLGRRCDGRPAARAASCHVKGKPRHPHAAVARAFALDSPLPPAVSLQGGEPCGVVQPRPGTELGPPGVAGYPILPEAWVWGIRDHLPHGSPAHVSGKTHQLSSRHFQGEFL